MSDQPDFGKLAEELEEDARLLRAAGFEDRAARLSKNAATLRLAAQAQEAPNEEIRAVALLEVADKMAEGIRRAVQSGVLDSRSMAADAELIYTQRRKADASALHARRRRRRRTGRTQNALTL